MATHHGGKHRGEETKYGDGMANPKACSSLMLCLQSKLLQQLSYWNSLILHESVFARALGLAQAFCPCFQDLLGEAHFLAAPERESA